MDDDLLNDTGVALEKVDDAPLESNMSGSTGNFSEPPKSRLGLPKYAIIAAVVIAVAIAGIITVVLLKKPAAKDPAKPQTQVIINTQSLDNGTLNKLTPQAGSGGTKQQLTISADTLFKNSVEVQGLLKADQNLDVGGNVAVKGTTTLQGAVGINSNLAVRGALSVGGAISAASINVGSLAITTINVSGNLNFGGHLVPGGAEPTVRASNASGGGTVTVSGNDTAGTITINTGGSSVPAGELAIISFRAAFATTPKVQLTPITSTASELRYYVTRSATFFTVNSSTAATPGTSYVFDYLVTQ